MQKGLRGGCSRIPDAGEKRGASGDGMDGIWGRTDGIWLWGRAGRWGRQSQHKQVRYKNHDLGVQNCEICVWGRKSEK